MSHPGNAIQPHFPIPPGEYNASWMSSLIAAIQRALRLQLQQPVSNIHLMSPDGTVYYLSVNNAGVVSTTAATKTDDRPPL